MPEVIYLGQRIDKEGLHPNEAKITVILKAPAPKNLTTQSFPGIIKLLWEIPSKSINCVGTTVQAFEKQRQMVLEGRVSTSIPRSEEFTSIPQSFGTL